MSRLIRVFLGLAAMGIPMLFGTAASWADSFDGFTEPYRKIDVAASETGTVARLLVKEGDRVTAGQPLATLDAEVLEVSREIAQTTVEAQAKLESALAERDLRRLRLDRLEPLRVKGHASQEEVDRARADLTVTEANVRAVREQQVLDRLERKKIEAMIERRTVRSPIDGIVLKILKDEREFVSLNSASVMTLVQLDPLRVTFSLPTTAAALLKVNQGVSLRLADNGATAQGKVEFIAPITEAESGTVRVKILVDNAQGQYRCGIRCLLTLGTTTKDDKAGKATKRPGDEMPGKGLSVGLPKM
jgi:RND family efflux transporter MFP subunit